MCCRKYLMLRKTQQKVFPEMPVRVFRCIGHHVEVGPLHCFLMSIICLGQQENGLQISCGYISHHYDYGLPSPKDHGLLTTRVGGRL